MNLPIPCAAVETARKHDPLDHDPALCGLTGACEGPVCRACLADWGGRREASTRAEYATWYDTEARRQADYLSCILAALLRQRIGPDAPIGLRWAAESRDPRCMVDAVRDGLAYLLAGPIADIAGHVRGTP
jgi:hypothetical protein